MNHEYINKAYDSDTTKTRKQAMLENIANICEQHNGLCDAGNGVMIVDTKRYTIKQKGIAR